MGRNNIKVLSGLVRCTYSTHESVISYLHPVFITLSNQHELHVHKFVCMCVCAMQDAVGDTLEELWISYNLIEKLKGVHCMKKLKVLYMSNNLVKEWGELHSFIQSSHNEKKQLQRVSTMLLCQFTEVVQ